MQRKVPIFDGEEYLVFIPNRKREYRNGVNVEIIDIYPRSILENENFVKKGGL